MATESHGAETAIGTCVDAGGGAIGMPQLCFDWYSNQIFWLVVTLAAIFFILTRIALPRIASVLAERQGTILGDIAAAEELKIKAAEAEVAYNKALADARAEAQAIIAQTKAEIQKDLDAAMATADKEIAEKASESEARIAEIRDGAAAAVVEVARDAAMSVITAVSPLKANASTVSAAVEEQTKG